MIWYIKRQVWNFGPPISRSKLSRNGCTFALNRSTVIFAGGTGQLSNPKQTVDVFNFDTNQWTKLPDLKIKDEESLQHCSGIVTFGKNNQKIVMVSMENLRLENNDLLPRTYLYSFEMDKDSDWVKFLSFIPDLIPDLILTQQLVYSQGILFSIFREPKNLHYGYIFWENATKTRLEMEGNDHDAFNIFSLKILLK